MQSSYYPESADGRADWWQNKINNAARIAALLPAQAASIQKDAAMAVYLYRTLPQLYDTFVVQVHGYINTILTGADGTPAPSAPPLPEWPTPPLAVLRGIEARRIKWVQSLKNADNYAAEVDGATLQTEMGGSAFDPNTFKATLLSVQSQSPATVQAKARKARGAIHGNAFSGRKADSANWVDLGRFTSPDVSLHIPIATPGQAEEWEIRCQGLKADKLIGQPSDLKQVLVRG